MNWLEYGNKIGEGKWCRSYYLLHRRNLKLNILKWLIPSMILIFLLGWQYEHDPRIREYRQQIEEQRHQIEDLKIELSKAKQVKNIMRYYGSNNHQVYRAIMEQRSLEPVQAAIIIAIESGFEPGATSYKRDEFGDLILDENGDPIPVARGLMQICKCWDLNDYYDIRENVEFGCALYRQYLDKYGNWYDAITAYNAGEGNVGKELPGETVAYQIVFKKLNIKYNSVVVTMI